MADKENILAIDLGAKKTGLALATEGFVLGKGKISGFDNWQSLVGELRDVIKKNDVNYLVVGIPYSRSGERARRYRGLTRRLYRQLRLPVATIDETLTSFEAARRDQSRGTKGGDDDEAAAKIILEEYINARS